jgi:hypothetical protein
MTDWPKDRQTERPKDQLTNQPNNQETNTCMLDRYSVPCRHTGSFLISTFFSYQKIISSTTTIIIIIIITTIAYHRNNANLSVLTCFSRQKADYNTVSRLANRLNVVTAVELGALLVADGTTIQLTMSSEICFPLSSFPRTRSWYHNSLLHLFSSYGLLNVKWCTQPTECFLYRLISYCEHSSQ